MAEKLRQVEQMLELSEDEANSPEHLDSQVQKAQEQLLQLKRQQEQIEKQKRELEELSRRQEELERGRAEMTDKLTRSLELLLRVVGFAFQNHERARQLVSHLRAPALQFFLAPAQFLQLAFLFLDLFL